MNRPPRNRRDPPARDAAPARVWLYGRHAVAAALANPARAIRRVVATKNAADWLADAGVDLTRAAMDEARPADIDRLLPRGAVHQGLAAEVDDLPRARLKEICAEPAPDAPVVVLDQITDPQNIGAILRVAAAFGARAVIAQDRRTPPLSGALAKAAAGAAEIIPLIRVVNIARALEALAGLGYETLALTGEAERAVGTVRPQGPVALTLGAEGAGLRPGVAAACAQRARIAIAPSVESLNVSTACAVALYALRSRDF